MRVASVLFATACLAIPASAVQVARLSSRNFEGTSKAVYEGEVFIVLRLHRDKNHLFGTVLLAGFPSDLEGTEELLVITDEKLDSPINLRDLKTDRKTMSFHLCGEARQR